MRKQSTIVVVLLVIIMCFIGGIYWYYRPFISFQNYIKSKQYIGFDGKFYIDEESGDNLLQTLINEAGKANGVIHNDEMLLRILNHVNELPIIEIYQSDEKEIASIGPTISYIVDQIAQGSNNFILNMLNTMVSDVDVNIDTNQLREITDADIIPRLSVGEIKNVSILKMVLGARWVSAFPDNHYEQETSDMHKLRFSVEGKNLFFGVKLVGDDYFCYFANDNIQVLFRFYNADESFDFIIPEPNVSDKIIGIIKGLLEQFK